MPSFLGMSFAAGCGKEPAGGCGEQVVKKGCGLVGQFAIRSAFLLGAERMIAVDRVPKRLAMGRQAGAETLHHDDVNVLEALDELTAGRGPDACIDAVGMEAHGPNFDTLVDKSEQRVRLVTDRAHTLRQAIHACGKGGVISIPGVYGGYLDSMPMGAAFDKGLTFRMGQTHCQRYMGPLLNLIERGQVDPSFVVTHRCSLEDAPDAYKLFASRKQDCIKVVLTP
ncbi:MAG: hypothetical protein DLM53_00480 [Candidatus Eremiobacter antarcticus]|nr:MAG: hypothetical protein DLM53_00480 [Candidatus Eremiobacter sp. RRmetagenome_bin22]